jgi:2-polyprenyl-3-methyl-5-hydroxy-6-metoxy-1,4-benzoquinol methylase
MLAAVTDAASNARAAAMQGPIAESPDTAPAAATPGEAEVWDGVRDLIGDETIALGHHWSFNLRNDPKRFPFVLSRYKFAAKLAAPGTTASGDRNATRPSVLELGCSEGLGTMILAEHADRYLGVDLDADAVATAQQNWATDSRTFQAGDFLQSDQDRPRVFGTFDGVVSLDVIEHIAPDAEPRYWQAVTANLADDGIAVIGTPNQTSEAYASPLSRAGHINLFTFERMHATLHDHFRHVLLFGLNDEVVHTGFFPMCHYVMGVGIGPKRREVPR